MEKILTVFTPAYNRAQMLKRTYQSLRVQTNMDFVWMIIDDGSTDNTRELVETWLHDANLFEIEYYYKPNGGMHTAHNLAYSMIKTELNVCIDSDDIMPPTAVEDIISFWSKYGSTEVAGIIALDSDMNGNIIGSELPRGISSATTSEIYAKYGTTGDKKFIYRTDAICSVPPYPEFAGERLVPLGYKYLMVDDYYPMLLMDKVVCNVDYQPEGSSATIFKQYLQSPKGFAVDKVVRMTRTDDRFERIRCIVHYIAECRIAHDKEWLKNSPLKLLTILLYPIGMLAQFKIIRIASK